MHCLSVAQDRNVAIVRFDNPPHGYMDAPMVEALVSGNLDFGMWGNTPIVRLVAQNQPLQIISVGEGHFRFILATRKDSPIRNIADLKGKTVGALLGGDPYNVLSQMLRFELGLVSD